VQKPKNANDHESERCAYIRRHLLKIVVATANALDAAVCLKVEIALKNGIASGNPDHRQINRGHDKR
jgi:hypothetical protein